MSIFSSSLLLENFPTGNSRDRSTIECAEWFCNNLYLGLRDGLVLHLSTSERACEVGRRQTGRAGAVSQLKTVPVLNHLLVLRGGSVSALNMFSLEPVPGLKKIQNVSALCVSRPDAHAQPDSTNLFTFSSRRRGISVHTVWVDRWERVGRVDLPQDPVALAVWDTCLCVATSDRYYLHHYLTHRTLTLLTHNLPKHTLILRETSTGEFLLTGPGHLGMLVRTDGISERPPVPWVEGVMDAVVDFPYVLALDSQTLYIYSMLDQQLKQTISIPNGKTLLSTTGKVLVVAEREVHCLSQKPLEDQIDDLLQRELTDEALTLLDGAQALLPEDTYTNLYRTIICTSGWIKFYHEVFSEAKDLFIKGDLDPRELISLYPGLAAISPDYKSQHLAVSDAKHLWRLSEDDGPTFQRYLSFLGQFLRETRGTATGRCCLQDVDTALFKLYLQRGDSENLHQLLSTANSCRLQECVPELEHHNRLFSLGLLHQSHGQHFNAIQAWVRLEDRGGEDFRPGVFQLIVKTLTQIHHRPTILTFIHWVLQRDQKTGIQIFTRRDPEDQNMFTAEEVLTLLESYPTALTGYLEYLVHELHSEEEKHHTLLAIAYITHVLQPAQGTRDCGETAEIREKLQQLLWKSSVYNINTVQDKVKSSALHVERAILLGRAGQHRTALQVLVSQEGQQAAELYCRRTSAGLSRDCTQQLFLCLLQVYLDSGQDPTAALDLLNNNPAAFNPARVLQVLPGSWSLQLLRRFLSDGLRETVHQSRMRGLEKSLAHLENLRLKHLWMEASREQVGLDRSSVCHCCHQQISGPEFQRRTTGELIHTHCSSDQTC